MKQVRCAIYTRKSSEEGLEQAFNSLDAQREACAAYILSQASEGWVGLPDIYDDGGLSGGSLERPALQRLLAEVAAGRVDIIVVYKVDRLTRSLLDFSKLVEAFDKAGTSFVSVTQSFNTTTSMGRLTLNMLLSFAQFEREVTAERIRDKIAASKAKGMWMGGTPPIGYKPDGRSLAIVDDHAVIVRTMFDRYVEIGNVRLVADRLISERVIAPARTSGNGKSMGGIPFSRGQIYSMLKCHTYVGEVLHREQIYAGLHKPIIDRETWDRVQAMLKQNVQGARGVRHASTSLLAGKLIDSQSEPLIAVHATKGAARYRYYISRKLQHEPGADGMRIPAREIETAVCQRLAELFDDGPALAALPALIVEPRDIAGFTARSETVAAKLRQRDRTLIAALITKVDIHDGRIEIACDTGAIAAATAVEHDADGPATISLTLNIRLTRSGRVMRLVQDNGVAVTGTSNAALIRLIVRARTWWAELRKGEVNIKELAARERVTAAYMTRILRLAFLSPTVVDAILAGNTRCAVDAGVLTGTDAVSDNWLEQRRMILAGV